MKRKLLSLLLCAVLALGVLPAPAFAGYENFTEQQPYTGQFADVPPDAWYAENVELAYEYGLINGVSQTSFAPDNSLTMAEAVKLAACLHSIYQNGATDFAASSPWYTVYAAYALENGILSAPLESYEAAATRGAFADVRRRRSSKSIPWRTGRSPMCRRGRITPTRHICCTERAS